MLWTLNAIIVSKISKISQIFSRWIHAANVTMERPFQHKCKQKKCRLFRSERNYRYQRKILVTCGEMLAMIFHGSVWALLQKKKRKTVHGCINFKLEGWNFHEFCRLCFILWLNAVIKLLPNIHAGCDSNFNEILVEIIRLLNK